MAKVIKKAQVGLSFLAKYAGREAAENLAKSTAKGAMRNELERGAEKMSLKNLPAEIVNKRAGESSYRPTSLSERLSGARDDFRSTVSSRNKMAGSSSNKSGIIEKDYKGDNFKYKKGGKIIKKKAQRGVSIGTYTTVNSKTNQLNRLDKFKHSDGDRYYRSSGPRDFEQTIADENMMKSYGNSADSVRSSTLTAAERKAMEQRKGGKTPKTKAKSGKTMLKRKDGSTSQRGLWDNIRANKGSGKKPTAAMLKQEKKIKAKTKK